MVIVPSEDALPLILITFDASFVNVWLARDRRDSAIDRALGYRGPIVADSSGRLVDAPAVRASAALDGDPTTAWESPFRSGRGSWIQVRSRAGADVPETLDRLDLAVVADGRHSVPTRLEVTNGQGERRVVELDVPPDRAEAGATVPVTATFEPLAFERLRVKVAEVRPVLTREYDCGCDVETPVAQE